MEIEIKVEKDKVSEEVNFTIPEGQNVSDYKAVNSSAIQEAVSKGKTLVLIANEKFSPAKFIELANWKVVSILSEVTMDINPDQNTVMLCSHKPRITTIGNNVQLCYYHDRMFGVPYSWIDSISENFRVIKITKPWQITGNRPQVRRAAIDLGMLYPKNQFIVDLVNTEIQGKVHSACVFFVEDDERLAVYTPINTPECSYKQFIRHVFECYAYEKAYISKFHAVGFGIMRDAGMISSVYFTDKVPQLYTKPCSNHNAKDIENGPSLIMKLNKRPTGTTSGNFDSKRVKKTVGVERYTRGQGTNYATSKYPKKVP